MRFQNRDAQILKKIYENDGILAKRHIKAIFWPDKSTRAMEVRLSKLKSNNYISWPTWEHKKTKPIPEPVCWLGWKGAQFIAGVHGVEVGSLNKISEYRLRNFQKQLRKYGVRWVREPRWITLKHDLTVVDFRIAIENSVRKKPHLDIENWITESEFRSNMDMVEYKVRSSSGEIRLIKRGVCPDAYFEIVNVELRSKGEKNYKSRFLLELDMATHSNPSFGRDKARPYVSYMKSRNYKSRFGSNDGLWLVVTSGKEKRLNNLMRHTRKKTGDNARFFFFTTTNQMSIDDILTSPIWYQVENSIPIPLLAPESR